MSAIKKCSSHTTSDKTLENHRPLRLPVWHWTHKRCRHVSVDLSVPLHPGRLLNTMCLHVVCGRSAPRLKPSGQNRSVPFSLQESIIGVRRLTFQTRHMLTKPIICLRQEQVTHVNRVQNFCLSEPADVQASARPCHRTYSHSHSLPASTKQAASPMMEHVAHGCCQHPTHAGIKTQRNVSKRSKPQPWAKIATAQKSLSLSCTQGAPRMETTRTRFWETVSRVSQSTPVDCRHVCAFRMRSATNVRRLNEPTEEMNISRVMRGIPMHACKADSHPKHVDLRRFYAVGEAPAQRRRCRKHTNIKNNLNMAGGGGAHCRDAETDKKKATSRKKKSSRTNYAGQRARNIALL